MIDKHIEKSFNRLCEAEYKADFVFRPASYSWQGDWEGRAILAYCNLYEITGKKPTDFDKVMELLPEKMNEEGFIGPVFNDNEVDEQQIAGHSWVLCGLVEYYKLFKDEKVLQMAKTLFYNMYMRVLPHIKDYPLDREQVNEGGVSGSLTGKVINGWKLSSDVGCAFHNIDGVARYYALTKDENAKLYLDTAIAKFFEFDRRKARAQTHTTMTGARGMYILYTATGDKKYLDMAIEVFNLYRDYGMTLTYENLNWFERPDTWTEPCAVIDSFILAVNLYEATGDKQYLTYLRRVWFNGLSFCHRVNGGAGPNSIVLKDQPYLWINRYEAQFCCTMRYCELLLYVDKNRDLLVRDDQKDIVIDEFGRKFKGDLMYVLDEEKGEEIAIYDLAFPENNDKKYKVLFN